MDSPQGLAAVESPTTRLRLTSTKTGSAPTGGSAAPPDEHGGGEAEDACEREQPAELRRSSHRAARLGIGGGGGHGARLVARVQPRLCTASAGSVKQWQAAVLAVRRAVALRAAEPAPTRAAVRQQNHSPEVMQPVRAAAALDAGLALLADGLSSSQRMPATSRDCTARRRSRRSLRRSHPARPGPRQESPVPSEPAPRNLKNWRRDERRASA